MLEGTNVDYRKMYYHLAGAVETALRVLIAAQQDCESILLENDTVVDSAKILRLPREDPQNCSR